jgi:DNA-binding transcriptional regulator YiaG
MNKLKTGSNNIAAKLKKWRDTHDLSQRAAAEKIGVPLPTLQGWEQGRRTPRGFALTSLIQIIR